MGTPPLTGWSHVEGNLVLKTHHKPFWVKSRGGKASVLRQRGSVDLDAF